MRTHAWIFNAEDRSARHRFAVARVAERLISPVESIALCHEPSGRPYVTWSGQRAGIFVSLSRAGSVGAIALSDLPGIGVDIESVLWPEQVDEVLVRNMLTPVEQGAYDRSSPAALTGTWTRKEAVLKAMGVGLSVDPRSIELPPLQIGTLQRVSVPGGKAYNLQTWQLSESLLVSVCTRDAAIVIHDHRTFNPNRSDKPIIG